MRLFYRFVAVFYTFLVIGLLVMIHDLRHELTVKNIEIKYWVVKNEKESVKVHFEEKTFRDSVYTEIKRLKIKHPKVVMAQALLESNLKSDLMNQTNNLFGMRYPRSRSTSAAFSYNGYAGYVHWKESVLDYALYQAQLKKCQSDAEYIKLLAANYAEDPGYTDKINKIIRNLN